jgi:hypothetical protein
MLTLVNHQNIILSLTFSKGVDVGFPPGGGQFPPTELLGVKNQDGQARYSFKLSNN